MALSPADFYAFSSATGIDVPDDPYERAALAPQVLEFRRNQLKAPQQESNVAQTIGTAALAGAAAVGAGLAARRFFGRGTQLPKGPARSATQPIRTANLQEMVNGPVRKVANTRVTQSAPQKTVNIPATPAAQAEPKAPAIVEPSRPAPGTTENALAVDPTDRLIAEALEMRAAQAAERTSKAKALQTRMNTSYVKNLNQTATQLLDSLQSESLTNVQREVAPAQQLQVNNAVETGANQVVGRNNHLDQLDHQYDPTQVALLNEMADADYATMMRQDEPGITQQIEEVETRPVSSQEFADMARDEMIAQREALAAQGYRPGNIKQGRRGEGFRPGSTRLEHQLAATWVDKPTVFGMPLKPGMPEFNEHLSLPSTIRKAVEAASAADPDFPEEIREINEGFGNLKERTVVNIGPDAEITKTAAGTAIRGASPVRNTAEPQERTRQIFGTPDVLVRGAPDEITPDFPGGYSAMHQLLANPPEGERTDPYAVKRLKGGGAGIGVYGVQGSYVPGAVGKATGEYSNAALQKPTFVPKWLAKQEAGAFSNVSDAGLMKALARSGRSGTTAIQNELNSRQVNRESVALSEVIRRANVEGGATVMQLNAVLKDALPKNNVQEFNVQAPKTQSSFFVKQPGEAVLPPPLQLELPSNIVPATANAARARITPADQAAQQLEAYMSKLQRGRATPLTSEVRIQRALF